MLPAVANNARPLIERKIHSLLPSILIWLDEDSRESSAQLDRKVGIINQHSLFGHEISATFICRPDNKSPIMFLLTKADSTGAHLVWRKLRAESVCDTHRLRGSASGSNGEHQDALHGQCTDEERYPNRPRNSHREKHSRDRPRKQKHASDTAEKPAAAWQNPRTLEVGTEKYPSGARISRGRNWSTRRMSTNENEMSDGWRESALLVS